MTLLFLIRHGENEYTQKGRLPGQLPGIHLNAHGREQAALLAESLGRLPIKAIYASSLERAVETAEPLAKALKLDVELRPGLMDGNTGTWSGKEIRKLGKEPMWKIVQTAPSRARFPGGESIHETQTRVVNEFESICTRHPKDMVAVVFHADPILLVVAYFLGLPLDEFHRLAMDTGAVTLMAIGEGGARLLALNLKPPFQFDLPKRKK
jgi:broad specificity phosphatase PhoE